MNQALETDGRAEALREAIAEGHRFIERAALAIEELESDRWAVGSAEFAAAKRSSLDLTRALAKLRRARR